jgi:hypothetical protein
MKIEKFSLQPFPPDDPRPPLEITGAIVRISSLFAIQWALSGRVEGLVIPEPADTPLRKNGLWEETCFEVFFGVKDSPAYWEVNLSPAGHWNVYRFADYRRGMEEEEALEAPRCVVQAHPGSRLVTLGLDMTKVLEEEQSVELGVSAVIRHAEGKLTYWALEHRGPQPDFHRRDGFTVLV